MNRTTKEETGGPESEDGCSNTIVDHILKELQGINKIQEEISDLRQYLNSVSGSVDQVSCCVDSVLMEIEELYSSNATVKHSPQMCTAPLRSNLKEHTTTQRQRSPVVKRARKSERNWPNAFCDGARTSRQYDAEMFDTSDELSYKVRPSSYPSCDRVSGQDFPSPGSFSGQSFRSIEQDNSCCSQDAEPRRSDWKSSEMVLSQSADGWSKDTRWSEDECCSCLNSADELESGTPVQWRRYDRGEDGSTTGLSSRSSSEHLSILFEQQFNSMSGLSSVTDWRHPRKQVEPDIECIQNCPFSRSSGYHTMDAYADELCSGLSRSISCSTMGLTDCDDACRDVHSSCEHCIDVEVDYTDSPERYWPKWAYRSMSEEHYDPDYVEKAGIGGFYGQNDPKFGCDVVRMNKAMITFQSALQGALKRLVMPDLQSPDEYSSDLASTPGRLSDDPALHQSQRGKAAIFHVEYNLNNFQDKPIDSQESTSGTLSPSCKNYSMDQDQLTSADEHTRDEEFSYQDATKDRIQASGGTSDAEMSYSASELQDPEAISEADIDISQSTPQIDLSKENQDLLDPHHQKCLANIERALKEQRQRHRLSRKSHHAFSTEEFNTGAFQIVCESSWLAARIHLVI